MGVPLVLEAADEDWGVGKKEVEAKSQFLYYSVRQKQKKACH